VLDRTLFVLTADHGFAPVDHKISREAIERAVAAAGTRIVSDTYHTASYLWVQDERKAVAVAANIAKLQDPYIQSVYFRLVGPHGPAYIRASGPDLLHAPGMEAANQYLLSTFNGPNGPDVAVFLTEHAMIVGPGEDSWKGDHGGTSWEAQHLPLILSGPGIRRGYVSRYPAPLIDIAPTILTLLGVAPSGMQGVALADVFQRPAPAPRAAQQAQGRTLRPVVSALQAESHLELALQHQR
jgi:arylsulfatase A-like enzyme